MASLPAAARRRCGQRLLALIGLGAATAAIGMVGFAFDHLLLTPRQPLHSPRLASRQLSPVAGVGGWDIDVERLQAGAAGTDLVLIAAFDKDE